MRFNGTLLSFVAASLLSATAPMNPATADEPDLFIHARGDKGKPGGNDGGTPSAPTYYSWMSPEIQAAWDAGFLGQDVSITVVDDFNSRNKGFGNLGDGLSRMRHGEWTLKQAGMIAPEALTFADEFTVESAVTLRSGMNVINASYGFQELASLYSTGWENAYPQEKSIIDAARNGTAVISKSAGNNGLPIGSVLADGSQDFLSLGLVGTQSAIFVGATDWNGTVSAPALLAAYSNYPGANTTIQNQFLVVGVDSSATGLAGTSFAAPIISGYAAVLSSKFKSASETQIANQLLSTARQDTLLFYDPQFHGRGEASITRALAPASIR